MAQVAKTSATQSVARQGATWFWRSQKGQEQFVRILATIICVLGVLVIMFPIGWMLSTSLKTPAEVVKFPPVWIPNIPQWDNYRVALATNNPFGRFFVNTMYYACMVMIGETLSCSFIAYGFAR